MVMDSDIRQTNHPNQSDGAIKVVRRLKKVTSKLRKIITSLLAVALIAGIGLAGWMYTHRTISPVPKNVSKKVSFIVYYPDPKKLPAGYILDTASFSNPQKEAVLYSVKYDNNKKIVFSVQPKPSEDELQNFFSNYIPLRNQLDVSIGHAEIGAYNLKNDLKTMVSLTTKTSTWLIITAPSDINPDMLNQVLASLRQ
jgi:hypothetical protein